MRQNGFFRALCDRVSTWTQRREPAVEERRADARIEDGSAARMFVLIEDRNLSADAQLLDVSTRGARLSCRASFPVGVTVGCALPFESGERSEWFRIVWRTKTAEGNVYGVRSVDEVPESLQAYVAARGVAA